MTDGLLDDFASRLEARDGTAIETTAAEASAALEGAIEAPAVGVPIPIDGVDLPGAVRPLSTPGDLRSAATGVTPVRFGIAAYGTVAVDVGPAGDDPVSLFPDRHVAVLARSDLVPDVAGAVGRLGGGRPSVVLETGPSATADMGELVYGVHGPSDVRVVVVTDR